METMAAPTPAADRGVAVAGAALGYRAFMSGHNRVSAHHISLQTYSSSLQTLLPPPSGQAQIHGLVSLVPYVLLICFIDAFLTALID